MGTVKFVVSSASRLVVLFALLPLAAAGAAWSDTPTVEELSALLENGQNAEFLAKHAASLANVRQHVESQPPDVESWFQTHDAAETELRHYTLAVSQALWHEECNENGHIAHLREGLGARQAELLLDYLSQCMAPESIWVRATCARGWTFLMHISKDAEFSMSPEERGRLRSKAQKCAELFESRRIRGYEPRPCYINVSPPPNPPPDQMVMAGGNPFAVKDPEYRAKWFDAIRQNTENGKLNEEQQCLSAVEETFLAFLRRLAEP